MDHTSTPSIYAVMRIAKMFDYKMSPQGVVDFLLLHA